MATIRRHTSILSQTSLLYPQPEIDRALSNRSPNSRIPPGRGPKARQKASEIYESLTDRQIPESGPDKLIWK